MTDARVPNLAAIRWIMRLPLDPGAKLLLAALWSFAPFGVDGHASARDVFPSRRLLAEETGQSLDAVKRQLARLAAAGWIIRQRDGWDLRWREPVTVVPGVPESPGTTVPAPGDESPRPPVTADPSPDTKVTGPGYQSHHGSEDQEQTKDQAIDRGPGQARPAAGPAPHEIKADQFELVPIAIVEAKPDPAAELLAEHDRARRAAREHHGFKRAGVLRVPGSAAEAKTLKLIRARLAEHGEVVCRHVIAVLGADWLRDDSQLRPTDWTNSDAIWSTNFEKHREREVGSTFGRRIEVNPAAPKQGRFTDAAVWAPPPGTPAPPKREPRISAPPERPRPEKDEWA